MSRLSCLVWPNTLTGGPYRERTRDAKDYRRLRMPRRGVLFGLAPQVVAA
jgi:hypothetical protein